MWKSFYDQLRSSLGGIDESDLPSETLATWGLEDEVLTDLDDWYPNHESVDLESATDKAARRLRVYIRYYALAVCIRVGYGFIKKVWTDGQGKEERFEGDWKITAQEFAAKAATVKESILEDLGIALEASAMRVTTMGVASPDRDPVKEPRSAS